MSEFTSISFDLPKNQSNVIKVIGVGGGGSNAINHMFQQGIKGVDFVVCNTDSQALENSAVPNKIQLGVSLTEGLGAGANPEVGQQSAIESIAEIEKMLDTNTKMLFITAGMGGGTGTGAAPVIAQLAKERDILTVGIVTIPFQFEGKIRSEQAMNGVERLRKQVDSLIVINNNKLREVYGNLGFKAGFSKADEVLATAAKGIAEVITHHYTQNIDLRDAKTVLANSGTAIMGSSVAEGVDRAKQAIVSALDSPLLNDNKITGAKNVLLLIVSGTSEITLDEIGEINDHIQTEAGFNANIIMGVGEDETLGDAVAVTVIATGFDIEQQAEIVNTEPKKIIHSLEDEQKIVHDLSQKNAVSSYAAPVQNEVKAEAPKQDIINPVADQVKEEKIIFSLDEETVEQPLSFEIKEKPQMDLVATTEAIKNIDVEFEIVSPKISVPQNFEIITSEVKDIEVIEPEFVVANKEFNYSFDLFEEPKAVQKTIFDISEETKQMEVKDPINVVPVTEVTQGGVIKYSLEDFEEKEEEEKVIAIAKPVAKVEEPIDESLNFSVKQKTTEFKNSEELDNVSPFEMSIEETLKARAEERKRKMKEFNYKFNNSAANIDKIENEPAYKRMGIDVTSTPQTNNTSRMSLGTDSNDDLQLRSNNSFLHDNVD